MKYKVRPIKYHELSLLETFLYEAIFQRDGKEKLPKSIIFEPNIYIYIENFNGSNHDNCLVAEDNNGIVIGAVWTRILDENIKGFGNIDSCTPEFAISILPNFRNKGIGKVLMKNMISLLVSKGYSQVSLAVQRDNYAYNFYKQLGFKVISELNDENEYIMLLKL